MSLPNNETVIQVHIRADSLASLREQLQKALDEMGWAPAQVAEVLLPPPGPDAPKEAFKQAEEPEKPRRTRKAKEEAPAAPAADPTSASTSPAPTAAPSAATSPTAEPGSTSSAPAEAASPSTAPAPSSGPTHEQAKALAEKWMGEHPDGPQEAKRQVRGFLATFGVARVAELPADQIGEFMLMLGDDL